MKFLFLLFFICYQSSIKQFEPWEHFKFQNNKILFNFKNKSAHEVNSWLSKNSNIPIVMDPSFNKSVTIFVPQKIKISECFEIYQNYLNVNNFQIVKSNNILVIMPNVAKNFENINSETPIETQNSNEIKVLNLKNNNSPNLAKIINELFIPTINIDEILRKLLENDSLRSSR